MDPRVRDALEFLSKHLAEEISLGRLARQAGISRSHLSRLLRRETGLSPCAILKQMRLRKAEDLLVATAMPIKAIAAGTGYRYVGNFARDFRKAYGRPPGAFRAHANRAMVAAGRGPA